MITAKFGGTAITAQNLHCLKDILTDSHSVIVVSAVGREHLKDTKTTDLLKAYYFGDDTAWAKISAKYIRLVETNGVRIDVDKLLFDAKSRARTFNLDYCMSLGEELSARIVSAYLNCDYIEAEKCILFKKGKLSGTLSKLRSAFKNVKRGVVGGFYGGCEVGRQVFSRGGSDITGALCAVALDSTLYENWTDVNGVCVANPKRIFAPPTIPNLSYGEMYRLAQGGAEVLHPDAVKVAEKHNVPIVVRNYLNPFAPSTIVSNCPSNAKFLSVTEKKLGDTIQTTLLHNFSLDEVTERIAQLMKLLTSNIQVGDVQLNNCCVTKCQVSTSEVTLSSHTSILSEVYDVFTRK